MITINPVTNEIQIEFKGYAWSGTKEQFFIVFARGMDTFFPDENAVGTDDLTSY